MTKRQPLFGGSSKAWDKQFVWPREHGRKRTFMSGIKDILGGKGPDIFITPKDDTTPIKMDHWANWDGYHDADAQATERRFAYKGAWNADRGTTRYDPFKRKYVQWDTDNNWDGMNAPLPTLTREEHEWMTRHPGRRYPNHNKKEWTGAGPNRKRKEYRPFWRQARRVGDNLLHGMAEESDHLASDVVLLDFYDRTGLTHGARRHALHAATKGRKDCFMGGPGARRYLIPQFADYEGRSDTRIYPPMNEACNLSGKEMEDVMGGRLPYWRQLERQPAYWNRGVGPRQRHMEQYYG